MKATIDREVSLRLYGQMLLIWRFEERSAQLYVAGSSGGSLHLHIGQEAVALGAISLLRDDDYFLGSYRDHGYALARGTDARSLMAEPCGKLSGISRGKGGSMHVPTGNFGVTASTAATCPLRPGSPTASNRATRTRSPCASSDGAVK